MKKIIALLSTLLITASLFAYSGDEVLNYVYDSETSTLKTSTNSDAPIAITTTDGDRAVTIDSVVYLIQEGYVWSLEVAIPSITANSTYYLIFDASTMTKSLRSFPVIWSTTNSYVTITLGTADSYTGGTDLSGNIFNRKSGADSREVEIYWNPTITNGVFSTYANVLAGSSETNQNAGGGSFSKDLPIILDNSTLYVFKIVTPVGDDIEYLKVHIDWAEIVE